MLLDSRSPSPAACSQVSRSPEGDIPTLALSFTLPPDIVARFHHPDPVDWVARDAFDAATFGSDAIPSARFREMAARDPGGEASLVDATGAFVAQGSAWLASPEDFKAYTEGRAGEQDVVYLSPDRLPSGAREVYCICTDVIVYPRWRGRGLGHAMLRAIQVVRAIELLPAGGLLHLATEGWSAGGTAMAAGCGLTPAGTMSSRGAPILHGRWLVARNQDAYLPRGTILPPERWDPRRSTGGFVAVLGHECPSLA